MSARKVVVQRVFIAPNERVIAQADLVEALVECTRARRPELLDWIPRKPHKALALADEWARLLDVTDWLAANPRPGIYLRQVDVPGVHSKFIEAHRGVLIQWLDRVLPPEVINTSAHGVSGFTRRYGFLDKPQRIRLRGLDPAHALFDGLVDADITLDADSFTRLQPSVSRVFITENEINFLAFPRVDDSLLVFGAGYGFEVLAFEDQWGVEEMQTQRDLPRLNADEGALYDDLRDNRIRSNLRLEQERIAFSWVEDALSNITRR